MTYGHIVVDYCPPKYDPYHTWLTVVGNLIKHPGEFITQSAYLNTEKSLFNSTISTPELRFMCCDIKDFYLVTPTEGYEYIRLTINIISEEVTEQYNLRDMKKMDTSMLRPEN